MPNRPTAVVVASLYLNHAVTVQRLLSSATFKVYTSHAGPPGGAAGRGGGGNLEPAGHRSGIIEGLGLGE
jgi:hypothetical protein